MTSPGKHTLTKDKKQNKQGYLKRTLTIQMKNINMSK